MDEYGMKPSHCTACGGEIYQYMDDEDYEYYKCDNCGKKIKVMK